MLKVAILFALIALSAHGVSCQNAEAAAAPEPYSYGYQTDTHAASEQRDPSGTVTGYYMLADADGRQRRVEYVADEAGFRAKVQTNELGTKAENSADVEVQASPATEAQLAPVPVRQQVQQQYTIQTQVPAQVQRVQQQYVQQPAGYGYSYYPGYGYGSTYNQGYYYPGYGYAGYGTTGYGVGSSYGSGYGSGYRSGYGGYSAGSGLIGAQYTSYNNHLPSQYYRSIGQPGYQAVTGYSVSSAAQPVTSVSSGTYRSSPGYQTVGVPVGYSTVAAPVAASRGSSNYLVLQKRDSQEPAAKVVKKTE